MQIIVHQKYYGYKNKAVIFTTCFKAKITWIQRFVHFQNHVCEVTSARYGGNVP